MSDRTFDSTGRGPHPARKPAGVARLLPVAAVVALALTGCEPKVSSSPAKKKEAATKVDYQAVGRAVEDMLPRIRVHVSTIAAFGPRQTGQAGCDATFEYVRSVLAEALPGVEPEEFVTEVTVPLDRTRADQLDMAGEPFTHLEVRRGDGSVEALPAYALFPNSAQACTTHRPERCPLKASASRPAGESAPAATATAPSAEPAEECPNCERFRPLVDLGKGDWQDFNGRQMDGAVVLLDFNSQDAWLRAAMLGARGAVFIEPDDTTLFQADSKYRAILPLHFPRLYVTAEAGRRLRRALLAGGPVEVCLRSRLEFRNVPARSLALTIPGRDRSYCYVLAGHFDARCIAPDLSYGAAEIWGLAELLEVARHLGASPPACDIHVLLVSGHWQSQQPMRDRLRPDGPVWDRSGTYFRIAMGLDMVPEGRALNLMSENIWDIQGRDAYGWLGKHVFATGGWRDEIFQAFHLRAGETPDTVADPVELFGDVRPTTAEALDGIMAGRNDRSPLVYAPRYPTAETPWGALGLTAFAFQTGRLVRLHHNTPLDRLERDVPHLGTPRGDASVDDQLRPQLQMALSVLGHLLDYPRQLLPKIKPRKRDGRDWGGYASIDGRALEWDRAIGWFAERLPAQDEGVRTFVQAYPTDVTFTRPLGARLRNYLHWPLAPMRGQHRELQSFMFQDLRLLRHPAFRISAVYAAFPETQYDVVGYGIDPAGRICYATDYGIHGDGNKAFPCTDLFIEQAEQYVPVSLFECGTLELFGLVDPQRYNPALDVFGSWFQTYRIGGDRADPGIPPDLKITGVKDVETHTDLERWGFTQYGPTAMVFLPADFHTGAEVLLGTWFTNFGVLNNPAAPGAVRPSHAGAGQQAGTGVGYRLARGQTLRLAGGRLPPKPDPAPGDVDRPTPLTCLDQLTWVNQQRLAEFSKYDVASPLAKRYHADSVAAAEAAREGLSRGDWRVALAGYLRAWTFESLAYRNTVTLLLDVVSTTVLYFVLLIPFSFLVERLGMPQRTVARTAIVSTVVFAVFAGVLYLFHPGFKLAHNVIVTTTAFVIVVLTVPALLLLLVRGVAMLRAIGSKAVITQRSEAESAGVLMAALSLAVSNMRRRRLRTALTLTTITTLVVALVLLTTSSAFDFRILEPSGARPASFEGIQVYNTEDRRQPLQPEMVKMYESVLSDEALVLRRECTNYGYDHKSNNGSLYLVANGKRVRLPYFQVMDERDNFVRYTLHEGGASRSVCLGDLLTEGEFLSADDVDVCLLPNNLAEALGVRTGDTVTLMGLALTVKGIWPAQVPQTQPDGSRVLIPGPLDRLVDLDGLPITAMRGSMFRQGEPISPLHAPSTEIVIVPRRWMARHAIFPTSICSMVVIPFRPGAPPDAPPEARLGAIGRAEIMPLAEKLAREILNVDVYTHYLDRPDGQSVSQLISMRTSTHVKGSSMMLVVLAVAVLMILAIMTGTVYERMREIHIFSSVGLSPRHVAGMFLIEALVYAGIASVLGYFLGIVSLKGLLAHLRSVGQQQEFYPNYLGVFVLYSIGTAVLATLLSSLYPIRLASKIVNPSDARTWQLEQAKDASAEDEWRIRLPFIATTWNEAQAMMVYACDYLAIHQGERSGRFVCQTPPAGARGAGEVRTLQLSMPVWLAPFERNLTQQAALRVQPTADGAWWEMWLDLVRGSGQPYLWRRGANVFVDMLCKHLLRWRAATPEQEADCLARAERVYPGT